VAPTHGKQHHDRKNHRRRADHRGADQHRLGSGLERVARPVVLFEQVLRGGEVRREPVVAHDLFPDAGDVLDDRQLEHRLRVVGDGPVGIDRDRHRPHAEEAERHQAERKHRRRNHQRVETHLADPIGHAHQGDDAQAEPVSAEVTRDQARENVERRAALPRGGDDLAHVSRLG